MRYEIFSNGDTTPVSVDFMGFSHDTAVTCFGPGIRALYIIHYVTEGVGYYNGRKIKAGQGFLIFPGQMAEYFSDENEPWEFLWIASSDCRMKELMKKYNADEKTLIFDYNTVLAVKNTGNTIISKNKEIINATEITELFLHLFNSHIYKIEKKIEKRNADIYLDFCLRYIEAHLHTSVKINELAEMIGVSCPYLYKIFHKRFNMSLKQYIIKYKLDRAKKLLIETDMSVTQIANSVGYNSVLDFSKLFKAKEGVSPQKYRETK